MNNNDIFKKLRVALMLRDDQIIDILALVDFRMSKGEIGNLFRNADHPDFMECGDHVLRNFLLDFRHNYLKFYQNNLLKLGRL